MRRIVAVMVLALGALSLVGAQSPASTPPQGGTPDVVQLRPNFYVIGGAGGNVLLQTGHDGVILVDSGARAASDRVLAAIRQITPLPIRYIINTSMDADHVG